MTTTVSVILLALIMGLGCFGASADYCQQAFNDAGYALTDSQLDTIVDIANDPYSKSFAQRHESALMDTYTKVTNGDGYTIADIFVSQATYDPTLDALRAYWDTVMPDEAKLGYAIAEGLISNAFGNSDTITVPQSALDHLGTTKRIYTADGGYFYMLMDTKPVNDQYYNCRYNLMYVDPTGAESQVLAGNFMPDIEHLESYTIDFDVVKTGDNTYNCIIYKTHWSGQQTVTDMPYEYTYELIANPDIADTVYDDTTTTQITINPDGTLTLPDGTVVSPNADGSYTIDGKNYYPDPAIPSDKDALGWIFSHVTDDKLDDIKFDDKTDSDTNTDVRENIDAQVAEYEGDLSEFMLGSGITQIFPFCLPFDLAKGIKLFVAQPTTPKFVIPINIPALLNFPAIKTEIVVDFSKYGTLVTLCRWFSTAGFIFFLIEVTFKIVKGAGT